MGRGLQQSCFCLAPNFSMWLSTCSRWSQTFLLVLFFSSRGKNPLLMLRTLHTFHQQIHNLWTQDKAKNHMGKIGIVTNLLNCTSHGVMMTKMRFILSHCPNLKGFMLKKVCSRSYWEGRRWAPILRGSLCASSKKKVKKVDKTLIGNG